MNQERVTLSFKPEAFKFMTTTIRQQKDFLHRCVMPEVVKKELIDNMSKISITIENAKRG